MMGKFFLRKSDLVSFLTILHWDFSICANVNVSDLTFYVVSHFFVVCWFYVEDNSKHFIEICEVTYYMTDFFCHFFGSRVDNGW